MSEWERIKSNYSVNQGYRLHNFTLKALCPGELSSSFWWCSFFSFLASRLFSNQLITIPWSLSFLKLFWIFKNIGFQFWPEINFLSWHLSYPYLSTSPVANIFLDLYYSLNCFFCSNGPYYWWLWYCSLCLCSCPSVSKDTSVRYRKQFWGIICKYKLAEVNYGHGFLTFTELDQYTWLV